VILVRDNADGWTPWLLPKTIRIIYEFGDVFGLVDMTTSALLSEINRIHPFREGNGRA
jgi:Fic/DOC family